VLSVLNDAGVVVANFWVDQSTVQAASASPRARGGVSAWRLQD
jgi:hypothetical protein